MATSTFSTKNSTKNKQKNPYYTKTEVISRDILHYSKWNMDTT